MDETLASFLKDLRKYRGLTQKELAKKAGTAQGNISKWENGEYEPSVSSYANLCKALDFPMGAFFEYIRDQS